MSTYTIPMPLPTSPLCTAPKSLFEDIELESLIGQGGFGRVYLGFYQGAPVAVKVLERIPGPVAGGGAAAAIMAKAKSDVNSHGNAPGNDFSTRNSTGDTFRDPLLEVTC